MSNKAKKDLLELVAQTMDDLPDSVCLSETHPANQQYFIELNALKKKATSLASQMRPLGVQAVKLQIQGKSKAAIARQLKCAYPTVLRHLDSDLAKQLLATLYAIRQHEDGASEGHRRHVLWEIAMENKQSNPKIAISALVEINQMQRHQDRLKGDLQDNIVNIQINNEVLQRGALD